MYTDINFPSKKALKDALAAGHRVTVYSPGPFDMNVSDGWVSLEGPHYPKPHRWYTRARLEAGRVVEVK